MRRRTPKARLPALRARIRRLYASGYGPAAVGRMLGLNHATVLYHCPRGPRPLSPRELAQYLVRRGGGL